jgi:hypothetical protein
MLHGLDHSRECTILCPGPTGRALEYTHVLVGPLFSRLRHADGWGIGSGHVRFHNQPLDQVSAHAYNCPAAHDVQGQDKIP